MRDGAELLADVFEPQTRNSRGTVLIRAPYGRGYPVATFFAQPLAARDYHVVVQSVRGTYGSEGAFVPAVNEIADGMDTVVWLREQPWFDGNLATIGASYLGLTQWALMENSIPELKAAVIMTGPHDNSSAWATGAFAFDDYLNICAGIGNQNDENPLARRLKTVFRRDRFSPPETRNEVPNVPLGAAGRKRLGAGAAWWQAWLEHPDRDDSYWQSQRFTKALEETRVPVLLVNGWQDLFLEQTLEQYRRLRERGVEVALTIGPWTHARLLRKGASVFLVESLNWFNAHLGKDVGRPRRSAVRIHVKEHGWLESSEWPPAMPEKIMFLQPDGQLGEVPPRTSAAASTFTYDPSDPTPTVGGRLISPTGGYRDDTELALRPDVLTFTTTVLTEDLFVIGVPKVQLVRAADNPHVDLFVRLSEVAPSGLSNNVTEGYQRMPIGGDNLSTLDLALDATAYRFAAGSRLRLLIAGGSYPRFAFNPGTGDPIASAQRMATATHRVHHGAGGASRLILPASNRLQTN